MTRYHLQRPAQRGGLQGRVSGDIFDSLLGYRTVGSAPIYNIRREVHGAEDNRPADAVLGFLGELDPETKLGQPVQRSLNKPWPSLPTSPALP